MTGRSQRKTRGTGAFVWITLAFHLGLVLPVSVLINGTDAPAALAMDAALALPVSALGAAFVLLETRRGERLFPRIPVRMETATARQVVVERRAAIGACAVLVLLAALPPLNGHLSGRVALYDYLASAAILFSTIYLFGSRRIGISGLLMLRGARAVDLDRAEVRLLLTGIALEIAPPGTAHIDIAVSMSLANLTPEPRIDARCHTPAGDQEPDYAAYKIVSAEFPTDPADVVAMVGVLAPDGDPHRLTFARTLQIDVHPQKMAAHDILAARAALRQARSRGREIAAVAAVAAA